MTLNLMLTSEYAVYLSGDFRLTYKTGSITDDYNTQKLIPVFKFGWGALVSFAGIAKTSNGLDVGDWIAKQLHNIPMKAKVETLSKALLESNTWLSKISPHQPFIVSVVGFSGRRPFATVLSNFHKTPFLFVQSRACALPSD